MTPLHATSTSGEIAERLGAELLGPADLPILAFDAIENARQGALTFIRSQRYAALWKSSDASAALVSRGLEVEGHDAARRALLFVDDADRALAQVMTMILPEGPARVCGVHERAVVHPQASVARSASVGPGCVVEAGAIVGEEATLVANVFLGEGSRVGAGTTLHPGVVVAHGCSIGERCTLHAGVSVGADGFGYTPSGEKLLKIPHPGGVRIGDDVDIGANSCVDRAKLGETVVGEGTKIDNLVQIGHGCRIGRHCIICGHCAVAGSVTMGDGVVLAGGVGIADNIAIGERARIGPRASVINDIPAGEDWVGSPAHPAREALANYAAFRRLAEMSREVRRLARAQKARDNGA